MFGGVKFFLPKARPILVSIASKPSLRFVFWALPLAAHASLVLPLWVLRLGVCPEDLAEALEFFLVQFETAAGQTGICSWDLAFINMPVCLHSKSHTDKTVLLYDICFLICDLIVLYIMIRCTFAFAQHIWRVPSCKNTDVCCYVYPRCR